MYARERGAVPFFGGGGGAEASNAQNEEVKNISAWAAILFAPTLAGSVYAMNFDHVPELHGVLGYPLALTLRGLVGVVLHGIFRRRHGS